MKDGYKIVNVDSHMMEPEWLWERHIEDRYKSAAPKMGIAPASGRRTFLVEGEPFTREKGKYPMAAPAFFKTVAKAMERFRRASSTGFSPQSRLQDMDEQGVDVQILYPTFAGQMLGRRFNDPELLAACCRAYNNWAIEYCSANTQRLHPAAILPMQDVDKAVVEANRAAKLGAVSFYVRPNPVDGSSIFDDYYLPLWTEVEKAGPADFDARFRVVVGALVRRPDEHARQRPHLVASFRGNGGDDRAHLVRRAGEAAQAQGGPCRSRRRMGAVLAAEDGAALELWRHAEHEYLTKPPTEYFKRNFWVAFRGDEPTMKAAVELVGDDNFLWDTDYPHPDGTFPWGIDAMMRQPIEQASRRKILWDNAVRAFNLN